MSFSSISELLAHASLRLQDAGVEEPLLEAQLLLAHALRIDRSRVLAMLREPLPPAAREDFESYVSRRAAREPTAYITGRREFYGLEFQVSSAVLIPRPETELLVDVAREEAASRTTMRVVDVGTGSGAVAVAVAVSIRKARVLAIDASPAALEVAAANVKLHHVGERVGLVEADLFGGEADFDLLLANLPYVPEADWRGLAPEVRDWEPREALVGGEKGTEVIERFLVQAPVHARPGAVVAAEFGVGQAAGLVDVARACFPAAEVRVRTDLAGIDRVLEIRT